MMNDEDILIIGGAIVLAVIGIVWGLTASIRNMLLNLGLSPDIAGPFTSFLFFLILILLIILFVQN